MIALLAILISGVLLDTKNQPIPKYSFAFVSADGKMTNITTDKDGKFWVDLAPGTYRYGQSAQRHR